MHSSSSGKVCIFCYKVVISSESGPKENDVGSAERFLKFLGRFVQEEIPSLEGIDKCLVSCEDCGLIISSFCEVYHEWKCLELQLEWKLGSLVNIMRFANKVPSRMGEVRRVILEGSLIEKGVDNQMELRGKRLKSLKSFRTRLIRKCARKLSRSCPRVDLEKIVESSSTSVPMPRRAPTVVSGSEANAPVPSPLVAGTFLGWSMSLAAVTMLASMSTQSEVVATSAIRSSNEQESSSPSVKKPPQIDELDEDDDDRSSAFEGDGSSDGDYHEETSDTVPDPSSENTEIKSENEHPASPPPAAEVFYPDDSSTVGEPSMDLNVENKAIDEDPTPPEIHEEDSRGRPSESLLPPVNLPGEVAQKEMENSPEPKVETPELPQRYNLREKRKRVFMEETEEDTESQAGDEYQTSPNSDLSSSSSESDASSEAEDNEEEDIPKKHCDICQRDISEKEYERHSKKLHDTTDVEPEDIVAEEKGQKVAPKKCRFCKKSFKTQREFDAHLKLHDSFKCEFCEVVKKFAPDLAIHESEKHAIRDDQIKKVDKNGFKLIPCSRCPVNFFRQFAFTRHFLSVHLNVASIGKAFSCSICQAGFTRGDSLEGHLNMFHKIEGVPESEIFRCDLCPAYFLQGNQLQAHNMAIHLKKKCPVCGKTYSTYRVLRDHLEQIHPDFQLFSSATFTCDIGRCRKQFPSEKALDHHKKTYKEHDEDETLKCDVCHKEFEGKKTLNAHKYYVHRDRSFICSECGKTFVTKVTLDIHMTYHEGPEAWKFQCAMCGRKFADKQKVDQHQRTHTKEKPFICQYCGEKYAHRHNWRNHVKMKHPEEFEQDGGK